MIGLYGVTKKMEFWLAAVNILGSHYKIEFLSVYSIEDRSKKNSNEVRKYIDNFAVLFTKKAPCSSTMLFEGGEQGAYDIFRSVSR